MVETQKWTQNYPEGVKWELNPLPFENLDEYVKHHCKRYSHQTAYTTCLDNGISASMSFAKTSDLADDFACFLRWECQLQKGDRVAIQLPNCLGWPVSAYGVLRAGCTLVNVNPLYTARELNHQLKDSGAKVLVVFDLFADKVDVALEGTNVTTVIKVNISDLFPLPKRALIKTVLTLKKQIPKVERKTIPFNTALSVGYVKKKARMAQFLKNKHNTSKDGHDLGFSREVTQDDIACLQYTGGTTGISKGAILTHRNLLSNIAQVEQYIGDCVRENEEVLMTALPLYHIFAFTANGLFFLGKGSHNILIPSPRPISNLRKAFEKFSVTWITGVNTLFNALCHEPWFKENPPRNLKYALAGGTSLVKSTADKWKAITQGVIAEAYGLTETSPAACINPMSAHVREESIGLPIPGTAVRVVDAEGKEVPHGERGELQIKGPQVMRGYWNRPEETKKVLSKDGWFSTGDVAIQGSDGYLKIVDRIKDMILVSGFNVYPNEIEEVIMEHDGVQEAAVIGVKADKSGEQVKAFIVPNNDRKISEEELIAFCREKLTSYKVPKLFEFCTELPKTNVGKILRRKLKEKENTDTTQAYDKAS